MSSYCEVGWEDKVVDTNQKKMELFLLVSTWAFVVRYAVCYAVCYTVRSAIRSAVRLPCRLRCTLRCTLTRDFCVNTTFGFRWACSCRSLSCRIFPRNLWSLIVFVVLVRGIGPRSMQSMINYLLVFPVVGTLVMGYVQSLHRPMLQVVGLVDLHYVVGALLLAVAVMGVIAGHLRHHLLLQVHQDHFDVCRVVGPALCIIYCSRSASISAW